VIWSGKRVAEYVEDVDEDMIQPNGVDLRVGECYLILSPVKRKPVEPKYNIISLEAGHPYIIRFKNKVRIPEKTVGMFFVRSTMWRKRGILIQASLWDTGYVGRGEVLVFPTINTLCDSRRKIWTDCICRCRGHIPVQWTISRGGAIWRKF